MNKKLIYFFFAWIIISNCLAANICKNQGYSVLFFNGVWNTYSDARKSMAKLKRKVLKNEFNGEAVNYELFYNDSGLNKGGLSLLEDVAEVFNQRSDELDELLKNRWEIFWEMINGKTVDQIIELRNLVDVGGKIKSFLTTLKDSLKTKMTALTNKLLFNPPTLSDYAIHKTRINGVVLEKKKILLVAHSQGNLFVNQAYNEAIKHASVNQVKVVHIAPASIKLNGDYILADLDLVINGLRTLGSNLVPATNVEIPMTHLKNIDFSGHKLIETYLHPNLKTFPRVSKMMVDAMNSLAIDSSYKNYGFFTVTLNWDGSGDADLHVIEPTGDHVYFSNKQGYSGFLDYDNTYAYGPEHYYANCNQEKLSEGVYQIGVKNYRAAEDRRCTIQIATDEKGEISTHHILLDDSSKIHYFANVLVRKVGEKYEATMTSSNLGL